jgi:hypothetical protein
MLALRGIVKPEAVADGLGSFTAPTVLNISAITAGGTTTLYVSVGEGQ